MASDFLSDIELYYTESENIIHNELSVVGEECKHIQKVMRHSIDDELFLTNGNGVIYQSRIIDLSKNEINFSITKTFQYQNEFENITICIPRLKSQDRFEFALEKSIELGITDFVIFNAERSVAKGAKLERWNKIALSAMKQSLRSFKPQIEFEKNLKDILSREGEKIYFDQTAEQKISNCVNEFLSGEKQFLIFGPEGGLAEKEIEMLKKNKSYRLTENRLRAETAVVTAVSLITNL